MNIKPKLLSTEPMSLHSDWLNDLVAQYFELEPWDPAAVYNYATTLMLLCPDQSNPSNLRCVIDNLWEAPIVSDHYVMQNPNWFWYNESLWYTHLGYDRYTPAKTYTKLALVPMRKQKNYRDFLVKELATELNNSIWSYVEAGRLLPDDDTELLDSQRYFNPVWYDSTYFSIVAESNIVGPVFITEKTFKPIAFRHPFIVYSNNGTLAQLHELGFETFGHLFNESYDSIISPVHRGVAVVQAVKDFVPEPYGVETLGKLAHNHAHFFDRELVEQRIRTEILEPLLHYAETP